jgi:excisionase family DNA binding protein
MYTKVVKWQKKKVDLIKNGDIVMEKDADSVNGIKQLLSITQLAYRLGVGKRTIGRWMEKGMMPAPYRVGHSKKWDPDDIELWLKSGSPNRKKFEKIKAERIRDGNRKKGEAKKNISRSR